MSYFNNKLFQLLKPLSLLSIIFFFPALSSAETVFKALGDLSGGGFKSEAHGVSADGKVVVGASTSDSAGDDAFRWTQSAGMTQIDDSLGIGRYAEAVSHDGSFIVGSYSPGVDYLFFLWHSGRIRIPQDILGGGYASLPLT